MFKAAPNVKGYLMASVGALSNVFLPDNESYAKLAEVLSEGGIDHTYIKLGEVPLAEYVRVDQLTGGTFLVNRGADNTIAGAYPALTEFEYVLAADAVQDMIGATLAPVIVLTGVAPIVVTPIATNQYEISVPEPSFISSDASIDITGTFPSYDLNVVRGANGCCD